MTRQLRNLITHLLLIVVFVSITNVGACAEVNAEIKELIASAEKGNAEAQTLLGARYMLDLGVPQDYQEAAKWFRKAAEQGHAFAQLSLGFMYAYGKGVLKDDVKAYAWFNVASANGHKNGSDGREGIAKEMTPDQIAEAQKLSREWFEKYQSKE